MNMFGLTLGRCLTGLTAILLHVPLLVDLGFWVETLVVLFSLFVLLLWVALAACLAWFALVWDSESLFDTLP